MLNINSWELVILVVLFLVVFGPERVPEVAIQVGKLVREFRKATESATAEITRELEAAAREARQAEVDLRQAGEATRASLSDAAAAATGTGETDRDEASPDEASSVGA